MGCVDPDRAVTEGSPQRFRFPLNQTLYFYPLPPFVISAFIFKH